MNEEFTVYIKLRRGSLYCTKLNIIIMQHMIISELLLWYVFEFLWPTVHTVNIYTSISYHLLKLGGSQPQSTIFPSLLQLRYKLNDIPLELLKEKTHESRHKFAMMMKLQYAMSIRAPLHIVHLFSSTVLWTVKQQMCLNMPPMHVLYCIQVQTLQAF